MVFIMIIIFLLTFFILPKVCLKVYGLTYGINKCSRHLVGKYVIVTGGTTGIGYETAKDLADRGARVIIACEDERQGPIARDNIITATGNKDVHFNYLDLASLASVRKFAQDIIKTHKQLDVLINNAGVLEAKNVKSEDGLSLGMQINFFGPFLLTNLLLPLLRSSAPSRIINVSSTAYQYGRIDIDNLNFEKETEMSFNFMKMYSNSKLCINLMTVELARQLDGTQVTTNCLHPGAIGYTSILSRMEKEKPWIKYFSALRYLSRPAWAGAQTTIYLAVSPEVSSVSGRYFTECREQNTKQSAKDVEVAKKLWEVSERLVKLK